MKNAILLHGKPGEKEYYDPKFPSSSNYHWFPWLQKQLIIKDIKADTPEIPYAFKPEWDLWVKEIERFEITSETILVGHSCGAGFWARYLSEHKDLHTGKVVLVAPSLGLGPNWRGSKFFDFEIDPSLGKRVKSMTIMYSESDKESTREAVKILKKELPGVVIKEYPGMGHFTHNDMKTAEFPELLEECIK